MDILLPLLFSAPIWLVLLIGIVYGVLTIADHRNVSILGIVALGGFLLLDLTGTLVWALYEWFVVGGGMDGVSVWVTDFFWLVQTLIHALFLALAIAAAALGREGADAG